MDIGTVFKIGLDLHGVCDKYPVLFRGLAKRWIEAGYEVHIVTGQRWPDAREAVSELEIPFTHSFSVVDHHREQGTYIWYAENGPWMDNQQWDSTKGLYARQKGLSLHFDDTVRYAEYFPKSCSFVLVGDDFADVYWQVLTAMLP